MTSYIIFSDEETERQAKLEELCHIYSIDHFDKTLIQPEKETSIGIEVVKKLQEKAMLKPLRGENKAIILSQSELLTVPAQNALLKLLEEPPAHTYFFLLTSHVDSFLPTILSRCQVIKIENQTQITAEQTKKLLEQLSAWQHQSVGDALKAAEKLAKDKESTPELLKSVMAAGAVKLQQATADQVEAMTLANQLKSLQRTYRILTTTNTNPRLALENLFLSMTNL